MKFPIYRKYKGIDVWFKINSLTNFTEYKKLGSKLIEHEVDAKIYPEQQFIRDMIECYENRWENVREDEIKKFINN
jgi:hypothetical protein